MDQRRFRAVLLLSAIVGTSCFEAGTEPSATVLTPAGGVYVADPVKVTVPANAVPSNVEVQIVPASDAPPSPRLVGFPVSVILNPKVTLAVPATIDFRYAGFAPSPRIPPATLQLFHSEGGAWVAVNSTNDSTGRVVSAQVNSFSDFALLGRSAESVQGLSSLTQSAKPSAPVADPPSVRVVDSAGVALGGITVTFAVTGGGGSISPASVATDAMGTATATSWTIGPSAGATYTAAATAADLPPVTFTATTAAGAPVASSVAIDQGDGQTASAGTAVTIRPSVVVRDQFNAPFPGATVIFAVASGGGNATGVVRTTGSNGIATIGSWTLGVVAGVKTLTATVAGAGVANNPVTFTATALTGNPAKVSLNSGDAQSAPVGTPVAVAPSVVVRDQFNNPVQGVVVTFAAVLGGGNVNGGSQTTGSNGVATVGSWTLGPAPGTNALTATANATGITGNPIAFTATATGNSQIGPGAKVSVNAGNGQAAPVGAAVAIPPSVLVLDQSNNPIQGADVTFAVALGGGAITGATQTTGSNGIATVGSWTLGTTPGTNALTATVNGSGITGNPIALTATSVTGPASQMALNDGDGQSANVGTPVALGPSVVVKDQFGNPVQGVSVSFAASSGGGSVSGASQVTNANGVARVGTWTLGPLPGPNSLTATSAGLAGSPITFTAAALGTPTQIALNAGDGQSATVGTAVAIAPSVLVTDQGNNPVQGVSVTFVAGGGGSVVGASQTTGANGIAKVVKWTLGPNLGPNTLTAASGSLAGSPVTFTATGTAPVPAASSVAVNAGNNQTATVGSTVATPPSVIVKDQFNSPFQGATVTFAITSGGGSITGATQTTGVDGVATLGSWTMGSPAGNKTVIATVTGSGISGNPVTFNATAVAPPAANSVAVSIGNNQSATVGSALGTSPAVIVRDQFNAPFPGATVTFAVTTGGGSITGATQTTGSSGVATVGSWTLGTNAGTNKMTATAAGSGITGNPVTFTATGLAGAATQIAVNDGNGLTATKGLAVPTPPSVIVRDQFNNPVQGVAVAFAVTGGGGSLTGASQSTASNGVARVGSWTLGPNAGTNTLSATSAGLSGSPVVFTVTGIDPPLNAGLDWFADWRTALGSGTSAVRDGTKFSEYANCSGDNLLNVVLAVGLGFPVGMTNVLQVPFSGTKCSKAVAEGGWRAPAVGEYVYYRWYFRNTLSNGVNTGGAHVVESHIGNIAWKWNVRTASGGKFDFEWSLPRASNLNDQVFGWSGASTNTTYRVEWRVLRTSSSAFTTNVRVYNASGTLVASDASFVSWAGSGWGTLATRNPSSSINSVLEDLQSIDMGQSGQSGSGSESPGLYFGGVAVRVTNDPNGWIDGYPTIGAEAAPGLLPEWGKVRE